MRKRHCVVMAVIATAAAAGFWLSMSGPDGTTAGGEPTADVRRFKPTAIELVPPDIPEAMRLVDRTRVPPRAGAS